MRCKSGPLVGYNLTTNFGLVSSKSDQFNKRPNKE